MFRDYGFTNISLFRLILHIQTIIHKILIRRKEEDMKADCFTVLLAIILGGIMGAGCERSHQGHENTIRNVILVETEQNGSSVSKSYTGVVEEGKSVNAAFMTGGKILSLNAKEGDRVRKGQLLASLDRTDYLIGVNQLQVQYEQMTAEKKRMDEMFARHNIAPNDYEKFEAGYKQLGLQLEMAKNQLEYTKLYSPSDGFVSYRFMQPGELVDAGTPIYKITDDSTLEVSVDLPLNVYLQRNEIEGVYGTTPFMERTNKSGSSEAASKNEGKVPLRISSFTPDADNNQLYHMTLDLPSNYKGEITTGMSMTVWLEMKNEDSGYSLIPSRALFNDEGKVYVWVFNAGDSTISKKEVSVHGQPQENKSLVRGLQGNEKIVAAGVKQLKDGEKVTVVESPLK